MMAIQEPPQKTYPYSEHKKGGRVKRKNRKRRRQPFLLRSLARFQYRPTFPSSEPSHPDDPEWAHFGYLLASLLLTSGLAVLSAIDAKKQCLEHETYVLASFADDDAATNGDDDGAYQKAAETVAMQQHTCSQIFRQVIVPCGAATMAAGVLALGLVVWQQRAERAKRNMLQLNSNTSTRSHALLVDTDFRRVFQKLALLMTSALWISVWQTYNVAAIMLSPRNMDEKEENPYQSLAAVDRYGHVGDNANLYYLTWISEGLALALLYQAATACVRAGRRARRQKQQKLNPGGTNGKSSNVTTLLRTASWTWWHEHRRRQKSAWHNSLYRLRFRTGIWAAALVACCVIVASSQYVGSQILWPLVADEYSQHDWSALSTYTSVCKSIAEKEAERAANDADYEDQDSLPPQFCSRTVAAWFSGIIAAVLCATAIGMHLAARYCRNHSSSQDSFLSSPVSSDDEEDHPTDFPWSPAHPSSHTLTAWEQVRKNRRLPLRTELILSLLLSILTGFNAVFATGVQGPAPSVGNLYYASWLAYLLCVRIGLGCLEEFYNLEDEEDDDKNRFNSSLKEEKIGSRNFGSTLSQVVEQTDELPYQAPSLNDMTTLPSNPEKKAVPLPLVQPLSEGSVDAFPSRVSVSSTGSSAATNTNESAESDRVGHVRRYFFLSIFSVACAASAYDAASNRSSDAALTRPQLYMMWAPFVVSIQSIILTGMCLSKRCYIWVSSFFIGGVLSVVAFGLWLGNLILTMHSEDSWAVNGIGEIEMANLYYFSWASILTAGIHMTTYVKNYLGIKMNDYMSVVWVAIVKVCFVILGAALHIWHNISDNCGIDEITSGAVTFCSRTILAIVVALTGMFVGGLVVLGRMFVLACPLCQSRRLQAHIEMILSLFLVLLFGAAVALVTGIGGPGQIVGDLFYSTWLSFWVALGVFVSCYSELNAEEEEHSPALSGQKASSFEDEALPPVSNAVFS